MMVGAKLQEINYLQFGSSLERFNQNVIIMEKVCNEQESEYPVAFEVIGEPAIIINGVPNPTPGYKVPVHADATNGSEADSDPCFGKLLEGRRVKKMFGDQFYSGKVVKYDSEANWYRVVYEDGDLEDLWWHELEEVLLPLDISMPLEALALQWCKKKSVLESVHVAKNNRTRSRKKRSMEKATELLQAPCQKSNCHSSRALHMPGESTIGSNQYQITQGRKKVELFRGLETAVLKGEELTVKNHNWKSYCARNVNMGHCKT